MKLNIMIIICIALLHTLSVHEVVVKISNNMSDISHLLGELLIRLAEEQT